MSYHTDKTSANGGLLRGVLMHVSSLPSEYGIGNFGAEARRFIRLLAKNGGRLWSVLPLGPTGCGDSPYQSFSSFALNPYFIDIDALNKKGFLTAEECRREASLYKDPSQCDYAALYENRLKLLKTAYNRAALAEGFTDELDEFAKANVNTAEYARFMAERSGDPEDYPFTLFVQKELFAEWRSLRAYAAKHGVLLMGDIPIYCAPDSAEVRAHPELFMLDEDGRPALAAGVPPDYFTPKGQLWGNPVYDWEANRKEGYAWWLQRLKAVMELYDVLRIDHFRGFESFYAIPADAEDAVIGEWLPGCGNELFDLVADMQSKGSLPECSIVAEDLGFITPQVRRLLKHTGFPGMQVLQFAFGGGRNNPHMIKKWDGDPAHIVNKAAYTGTHDNPTTAAWWSETDDDTRRRALRYAGVTKTGTPKLYRSLFPRECGKEAAKLLCRAAVKSSSRYVILPMQDLLGLGAEARMNTPGTSDGNWRWRAARRQIEEGLDTFGEILK